ncbi:MAG: hypothetical protein KGJ62_00720 [Armatimonadetes bacterium]|nr:hypothetical protein [Armatimonadota bacterium]MDE2205134.1 hypothetical protein [Armatimonadota bacterium]
MKRTIRIAASDLTYLEYLTSLSHLLRPSDRAGMGPEGIRETLRLVLKGASQFGEELPGVCETLIAMYGVAGEPLPKASSVGRDGRDVTGEARDDSGRWTLGSRIVAPKAKQPGSRDPRPVNRGGRPLAPFADWARIVESGINIPRESYDIQPGSGHAAITYYDYNDKRKIVYPPEWVAQRKDQKLLQLCEVSQHYAAMTAFANSFTPDGTSEENVAKAAMWLLDKTNMRIGSEALVERNGSYGVTTLTADHITFEGTSARIALYGKSRVQWYLKISNRKMVAFLRACKARDCDTLFCYERNGRQHGITAAQVNERLRRYGMTARELRTFHATRMAVDQLLEMPEPADQRAAKRNIAEAIKTVAAQLHNTPAVCKASFINPTVMTAYEAGALSGEHALTVAEAGAVETDAGAAETEAHEAASIARFQRILLKFAKADVAETDADAAEAEADAAETEADVAEAEAREAASIARFQLIVGLVGRARNASHPALGPDED